jgi:peroxiredoxin
MRKIISLFCTVVALATLGGQALAAPKVGEVAPDFSLKGADGKSYSLKDFKGKIVVLEWFNKDCPYVKKHYSVGNMQGLQKELTSEGAVWLTLISSKKGKQGYMESAEAAAHMKSANMSSTAILIDEKSEVAKQYDARTTPHMYIIGKDGKLAYMGAIDDNSDSDSDVIPKSKNYVKAAMASLSKGEKVAVATTKPYGCGVKY